MVDFFVSNAYLNILEMSLELATLGTFIILRHNTVGFHYTNNLKKKKFKNHDWVFQISVFILNVIVPSARL
jgi:hypothetical protein